MWSGGQGGPGGPGGPGGSGDPGGPGGQNDQSLLCIQKIKGFHGLNHQIIEKVEMSRLRRRSERKWKTEKISVGPKTEEKVFFIHDHHLPF